MVQEKLRQLIESARKLNADAQIRSGLALVRVTLQYSSLPLIEWVLEHGDASARPGDPEGLRAPSDGTLVRYLDYALVQAEHAGWAGIRGDFFSRKKSDAALHFLGRSSGTLAEVLAEFIASRNDSLEGHGLPSAADNGSALLSLAELLLASLPGCFPKVDAGTLILESPDGRRIEATLLKVLDGDLVCYRKSKRTSAGSCRVEGQRQTSLLDRVPVTWEARDRLSNIKTAGHSQTYEFVPTSVPGWTPLVSVPDRLTETFTGRENELAQLADWFDDAGSRACLVWGEGGMGKTTLVVEFIHRILTAGEGAPVWQPKMVSYYSAKRTKWGTDGLQTIKFGVSGLADGVVDIVRSLEMTRNVDRRWIEKSGVELAKYFGSYLLEKWSVKPNEHLLILDNTETLTSSEDDAKRLGDEIRHLARYCARVIITSRRAEKIGADPVEVDPLAVDEGVALLQARAKVIGGNLLDAPVKDLRRYVEALEPRPLLLEVFAQTMMEHALAPDKALARVKAMKQKDLGEFLYADVWGRFSVNVQHLLLLMVRVGDAHDDAFLRLAAEAAGVSIMSATHSLEESRGIAKVTRIRGDTQITFRRGFLEFCAQRVVNVDGKRLPDPATVSRVKARYENYLRLRDAEVVDRVAKAFRKPFAKMALAAFQQGRFDECHELYELAVSEDPQNGLLFDRYALFLLRQVRSPEEALGKSDRAVALASDESDVWFTRGMILGLLKRTHDALVSLLRAQSLGKATHLVNVQIAYAHLRAETPRVALAREAVREARKASPVLAADEPGLFNSHQSELKALEKRLNIASGGLVRARQSGSREPVPSAGAFSLATSSLNKLAPIRAALVPSAALRHPVDGNSLVVRGFPRPAATWLARHRSQRSVHDSRWSIRSRSLARVFENTHGIQRGLQ